MRINNNISALTAYNSLTRTDNAIGKNLEKLSSGLRINRAADDAAGLAISEKMRAQVKGMNRAVANAQDGVSLVQTAEGALSETHSILQRMNELAVQASNGTNSGDNLANIQAELTDLSAQVDEIGKKTEFNGIKLLNGDLAASGAGVKIQTGANSGDQLEIRIANMDSATLLGASGVDVTASGGATAAITTIQGAIKTVSDERANLGAKQNRLDHTINTLTIGVENLTAAESRVRDVDMAKEMANFTKNQILSQAGTSMLAQANSKPQSVMSLLG